MAQKGTIRVRLEVREVENGWVARVADEGLNIIQVREYVFLDKKGLGDWLKNYYFAGIFEKDS